MYLEVRMATPVWSYCFTVEMELTRPAMLNGAPPKHDDMQAIAFVPEMLHFMVFRGCIFMDQLRFPVAVSSPWPSRWPPPAWMFVLSLW
jgi:hypothetical protein